MNCCNSNCQQGRTCPKRKIPFCVAAYVASVVLAVLCMIAVSVFLLRFQ